MKITLTLGKISAMVDGGAIAKLDEGTGIPWRCRFACAQLVAPVLVEHQRFLKLRDKAVRQFGVQEGNTISIAHIKNTPENIAAFGDALNAIRATEVELDVKPLA